MSKITDKERYIDLLKSFGVNDNELWDSENHSCLSRVFIFNESGNCQKTLSDENSILEYCGDCSKRIQKDKGK